MTKQISRAKLRKIIELTASIEPDGTVWGMDTDCGNIKELIGRAEVIMKKGKK